MARPVPPPQVTGHGVRALWQGAPWGGLTVAGGLVVGMARGGRHPAVEAVSALTGQPRWSAGMPRRQRTMLGLVTGDGLVVAEIGHEVGHGPAMVAPIVAEDVVLDLHTGQRLWTMPVPGKFQTPPLAIAGSVVVTGTPSGAITARNARTGIVVWRRTRPAGCPQTGFSDLSDSGMSLAGGSLLAASYECRGGRVVVQRILPGTGRPAWQWTSPRPRAGGSHSSLSVVGTASLGALVLLAGQVTPPATARSLASGLPRPYLWPARLGPLDDIQVVLALDAGTGRPRWTEDGGQLQTFALTGSAVCELANTGVECRDDITGRPTRPVLVSGNGGNSTPPYVGDGFAGVAGRLVAVTVAPFRSGHVRLEIVPVRGTQPVASAKVAIGTRAYHANYQTFVVGGGPLPGGGMLILLRRVDLPGYPVIALRYS
jgi:outer membrane protein assembly factor BamB